jgi:hypothetical protein
MRPGKRHFDLNMTFFWRKKKEISLTLKKGFEKERATEEATSEIQDWIAAESSNMATTAFIPVERKKRKEKEKESEKENKGKTKGKREIFLNTAWPRKLWST